jgi:hypothetical protein
MTHGELNLPVGKLSPALDDFLIPALRNTANNATNFTTCRLQGQRHCFKDNVAIFDLATVAVRAEPIPKKLRSIHDFFDRLGRDWPRASVLAQLRRYLAFHCSQLIVRHLPIIALNGGYQNIASSKIFHFVFVAVKRRLFSPRNRHADGAAANVGRRAGEQKTSQLL